MSIFRTLLSLLLSIDLGSARFAASAKNKPSTNRAANSSKKSIIIMPILLPLLNLLQYKPLHPSRLHANFSNLHQELPSLLSLASF